MKFARLSDLAKKTRFSWILPLLLLATSLSAGCAEERAAPPSEFPDKALRGDRSDQEMITHVGHGGFLTSSGAAVEPTLDRIRAVQEYYIAKLEGEFRSDGIPKGLIYAEVLDRVVANALFLDELLERVPSKNRERVRQVNSALRAHYLFKIRRHDAPQVGDTWRKGVPPAVVARLQAAGVDVVRIIGRGGGLEPGATPTAISVTTSGQEYVQQCRDAGVPVPDFILSSEWNNRGEIQQEFISSSLESELWSYESDNPRGVCLALPRWTSNGEAAVFAVICLGTRSSNACFFDNPSGTRFARHQEISIDEFLGGVDLVSNGQGICSDCHAGENPFVVHPEEEPFAELIQDGVNLQPADWHDPFVVGSWPQNPGPIQGLGPISAGEQRCDSCHVAGNAGRFPKVSQELSAYCNDVLRNAVMPPSSSPAVTPQTMPPYGQDPDDFASHRQWLLSACETQPGLEQLTDEVPVDDPDFVSTPLVDSPVYACANRVGVKGVRLDSSVELTVKSLSGTVKFTDTKVARNPDRVEFTVSPALQKDDVIYATQTVGSTTSALSQPVYVRNYQEDYPNGLPVPKIAPSTFHKCGRNVAVRHVPGADLVVKTNGQNPISSGGSSSGYTVADADAPFALNDKVTVKQTLCGDQSAFSAPEYAVAPPSSVPGVSTDPIQIYSGQELVTLNSLVHGGTIDISEQSAGPIGTLSGWPSSWFPNYDIEARLGRPLEKGDILQFEQWLCEGATPSESAAVLACDSLGAPEIVNPLAGDDFVLVVTSAPGATLRVWGSDGEIGDGAGNAVMLTRTLVDEEVIVVTQEVGECVASEAYSIQVQSP